MKKLLLATTLLASPALGADLAYKAPPVAPLAGYNWSGLYLDGFGLYAANFTGVDLSSTDTALANLGAVPHGPGIGGDLMYLTQLSTFILGARASLAYANLNASGQALGTINFSNATNYLGDVNAILGLPLSPDGRLFGYVTGGFAFGGAKPNLQIGSLAAAASDTSTGWDVGAGLRYALTSQWSVGIEGEYYKLGDRQLTVGNVMTSTAHYDIFAQKVVVGFRF